MKIDEDFYRWDFVFCVYCMYFWALSVELQCAGWGKSKPGIEDIFVLVIPFSNLRFCERMNAMGDFEDLQLVFKLIVQR